MQQTQDGLQRLIDHYQVPAIATGNTDVTSRFLVEVARKRGRLSRGGIPNMHAAALVVLGDLNEERLVLPAPQPKKKVSSASKAAGVGQVQVVTTMAEPFKLEGLWGDESCAFEVTSSQSKIINATAVASSQSLQAVRLFDYTVLAVNASRVESSRNAVALGRLPLERSTPGLEKTFVQYPTVARMLSSAVKESGGDANFHASCGRRLVPQMILLSEHSDLPSRDLIFACQSPNLPLSGTTRVHVGMVPVNDCYELRLRPVKLSEMTIQGKSSQRSSLVCSG
nr:nuclear gtp-binding protein nug1 [Quercus suber]